MFNPNLDITEFYSAEELATIKKEIAAAFMRYPMDYMRAISEVEPRITHHGALASLQYDKEVNDYMSAYRRDAGVSSLMPTKEEFAATVYREGMNARTSDVKLDFFKLFAQVMGYVADKKSGDGGTVNIGQQNVLVLPAKQEGKDFERNWIEYGRQLTAAS